MRMGYLNRPNESSFADVVRDKIDKNRERMSRERSRE